MGSRNYEHMSRGWWVAADYGTNPTHERCENRGRSNGNQRRPQGGKRNEHYARTRFPTTHPEKHVYRNRRRTLDPLDPVRATACSNPRRSNRGTIPKHYRACRTAQTRWVFLVQLGEHTSRQYSKRFLDTKRNRRVSFHRRQSSTVFLSLPGRHTPIPLRWVSDTSCFPSRSAFYNTQRHHPSLRTQLGCRGLP